MIPEDFKSLLPQRVATFIPEHDYTLWVFNPETAKVILEHNGSKHPAHRIDHSELAERVPHPDRVHGYAYPLRHGGGFRITDWDHKPVKDPYIKRQVDLALQGRQVESSVGSQTQSRATR